MKVLLRAWALLDRRQRRQLLLMQLLSLLMALSTVSGVAAILPFFTVLAEPDAIRHSTVLNTLYGHFGFASERSFLIALGFFFSALVLLSNAINLLGSLAMTRFAHEVGDSLRIALLDEYLHRDYAFHVRTHSSKLASNVIYETSRITGGIVQSGLVLVANGVTVVFILISIVIVNPFIAVAAFAALGAGYALTYLGVRRRLRRNGLLESEHLVRRAKAVDESLTAVKEVLLGRTQAFWVGKFARDCRAISTTYVSTQVIAQIPKHALECVTVLCLVGIALYLSGSAASGSWLAQLSFTGLAAYRLLPALQQAFTALVRIRADTPAFEGIATDLQQAVAGGKTRSVLANGTRELECTGPRHDIRLRNVSYRHPSASEAALRDVTLRIPAASMVGFVGVNGSGKTTLVDVLAGLLAPESGQVLIDGVPLDESNRQAWQSTIAYVPQDIAVFDATLAENIALGISEERIDWPRLQRAIRLAQLEECVASLPGGCREILGERGARLSGGQRQRIGIARALYRDAAVLILDEPTSSLDVEAERQLLDTLESLRGPCTIVLIAHRPGALRHCQEIFEFEGGRVRRRENAAETRWG